MRLLLFVYLLCICGCNSDRLTRLEEKNQELQTQLKQQQKTANLDLQAKCATQAREEFQAEGWGNNQMVNYTNHYNAKANKCFIEVNNEDFPNKKKWIPTVSRTILDAFEHKVYAEYFWRNDTQKKYWEVPPFMCKVTSLSGKETICTSTEQFDSLIKQFMEE